MSIDGTTDLNDKDKKKLDVLINGVKNNDYTSKEEAIADYEDYFEEKMSDTAKQYINEKMGNNTNTPPPNTKSKMQEETRKYANNLRLNRNFKSDKLQKLYFFAIYYFLFLATVFVINLFIRNNSNRYIFLKEDNGVYILDTKTGQLKSTNNSNNLYEVIERK